MKKVRCRIYFKKDDKEFHQDRKFSIQRTTKYSEFLSKVKLWVEKTYGKVEDLDILVEEFDGTNKN